MVHMGKFQISSMFSLLDVILTSVSLSHCDIQTMAWGASKDSLGSEPLLFWNFQIACNVFW